MARLTWVALVRSQNSHPSSHRGLRFPRFSHPPLSRPQQLTQRLQAPDHTEHRLHHADETEGERTLASPRGLAHGGADQRDESGDQGLESLLPYWGSIQGVCRPGPLHVLPRAALHETPPPTEIRLVENHEG